MIFSGTPILLLIISIANGRVKFSHDWKGTGRIDSRGWGNWLTWRLVNWPRPLVEITKELGRNDLTDLANWPSLNWESVSIMFVVCLHDCRRNYAAIKLFLIQSDSMKRSLGCIMPISPANFVSEKKFPFSLELRKLRQALSALVLRYSQFSPIWRRTSISWETIEKLWHYVGGRFG